MRVLQFALSGLPDNPHVPANHPDRCVVYTGTHDTDTTLGWWRSLEQWQRDMTGWPGTHEPSWSLIETAYRSRGRIAIVPMQDVLGLGGDARLNHPGQAHGNWSWRMAEHDLRPDLAERLRALAHETGRAPGR